MSFTFVILPSFLCSPIHLSDLFLCLPLSLPPFSLPFHLYVPFHFYFNLLFYTYVASFFVFISLLCIFLSFPCYLVTSILASSSSTFCNFFSLAFFIHLVHYMYNFDFILQPFISSHSRLLFSLSNYSNLPLSSFSTLCLLHLSFSSVLSYV